MNYCCAYYPKCNCPSLLAKNTALTERVKELTAERDAWMNPHIKREAELAKALGEADYLRHKLAALTSPVGTEEEREVIECAEGRCSHKANDDRCLNNNRGVTLLAMVRSRDELVRTQAERIKKMEEIVKKAEALTALWDKVFSSPAPQPENGGTR